MGTGAHPQAASGVAKPTFEQPMLLCLLGGLTILRRGETIVLRKDGKLEALLGALALHTGHALGRDALLSLLWPDSDPSHAAKSLHSLVYSLRRSLGSDLLVAFVGGYYRLTDEVGIDTAYFDDLVDRGDEAARDGDVGAATTAYSQALTLYRGDLCVDNDVQALLERERLRGRYLSILIRLGWYDVERGDAGSGLTHAHALLRGDPCREDAHRLAMRCYLALGERAQAMRQFRLCEYALRTEFGAAPEPATRDLYDRIRLGRPLT